MYRYKIVYQINSFFRQSKQYHCHGLSDAYDKLFVEGQEK